MGLSGMKTNRLMKKLKILSVVSTLLITCAGSFAADSTTNTAATKPASAASDAMAPKTDGKDSRPTGGSGAKGATEKQATVASTTAKFGTVAVTDDIYKTAIDAHALADALKLVDKDGAFKGKVAKVYEPRGLAIVEFDEDYKTALTAVVRSANFANFPAITNLIGKNVVITGKFIKYRETAEVVLEKPDQVRIVQ
jgi:hypothetical protein